MVGETFEASVKKHLGTSHVVIVDPQSTTDVAAIDRGVLIIHAPWSRTSVMCLLTWKPVIPMFQRPSSWLYVVDIDRLSGGTFFEGSNKMLKGGAESFWIRDRQIEHFDSCYGMRWESLVEPTRRLLE